MAVEKDATLGKHKTLSTFPPPRRRSLNNVLPGSAEARRRRKNSPTACRKTWWRKCVPSDRGIYKDRRVRIIIECPEKRFSTQRPDTFTRTTLSPNFKPLAVRRRTIHFRQLYCRTGRCLPWKILIERNVTVKFPENTIRPRRYPNVHVLHTDSPCLFCAPLFHLHWFLVPTVTEC